MSPWAIFSMPSCSCQRKVQRQMLTEDVRPIYWSRCCSGWGTSVHQTQLQDISLSGPAAPISPMGVETLLVSIRCPFMAQTGPRDRSRNCRQVWAWQAGAILGMSETGSPLSVCWSISSHHPAAEETINGQCSLNLSACSDLFKWSMSDFNNIFTEYPFRGKLSMEL